MLNRVLALDVGDVRIGLAMSDPMGIIANPLDTYTRVKDQAKDIAYLKELIEKNQVNTVVCGLPKTLTNTDSIQTQKVRDFAQMLSENISVPVKFFDERLSTAYAQRVLIEGNVRRADRKKVVDKVAAAIILQNYLDTKR